MGRFLAIFHGAAAAAGKADLTERQQTGFLDAWASWARANERALVDPGAPLYGKKRVTARGAEDYTDTMTGYAIVEAGSHDEAVRIFSGHPHLGLSAGNSIAVLECPPPPAADGAAGEVALRPVEDADLDALFEQMRDPESVRMAAFTAADPDDRAAFDAHLARILASPDVTMRAITVDGRLAGTVGCYVSHGDTEVTYWVDRSFWGRGVAGRALALLLDSVAVRPLYARAASDNAASLRVLQRAGFVVVGTDTGYANGRAAEIEETILRLDPGDDPQS